MEAAHSEVARPLLRRTLLVRGESMIASAGLALVALLVCMMSVSVWWAQDAQRIALQEARQRQVKASAQTLAESSELLLAEGELTAVRRMVANAARAHNFTTCRIYLPDRTILASAQPAESKLRDVPSEWPAGRSNGSFAPESYSTAIPLVIPNHGPAMLVIAAAPLPPIGQWDTAAGVCSIGTAALVLLLIVYRRMRGRLRAMGAVREALTALARGETAAEALKVRSDLGAEAQAWNHLIAETDRLRRQEVAEKAREALGRRQETKGELDAACDALSHGILLVDDKCRVRYANGAATVFLGGKREELVGSEIGKYLQVETVLKDVREVAQGISRRRAIHDVEQREEPGNAIACAMAGVLRFTVRPVRREDSGSAMVTIEDITQQRVAEESRNRFVAQATHELRTPLTNIRLYIETAIEDGEEDPATRARCLNVINGETRRLERIVGEMLSVAEIEAGSFEIRYDDVRLEALFEELKSEFEQQAAEKQVTLTYHLPPKFPMMRGDRDKILLAAHNLIANALKYTPAGGRVDVNVDFPNGQLMVQVKDNGIGISDEDQERIFDRFYRAHDPRVSKVTGTGLGLTLAREVVRLHGGDITVESQMNQGSTFTLVLPMDKKAA